VKTTDKTTSLNKDSAPTPKKTEYFDPLRAAPQIVDPLMSPLAMDPLSAAVSIEVPESSPVVSDPEGSSSPTDAKTASKAKGDFEFWPEKCPRILAKYTTSASIAVDNSFLNEDQIEESTPKNPKQIDQASSRLEEFEQAASNTLQAKSYMSQKDYIAHIEDQHKKLKSAWDAGERVVALRIAIQCAKLLGDMSVPAFYPSMFVILTRILDTFGDLVFSRIKARGIESIDPTTKQIVYSSLPSNFKASDVAASAKETCKNWFYKTTCIRELLPRFYIDLALIKCYRFLEDDSFSQNLNRLAKTIRGIGDPLTAAYARVFLTSKALDMSYAYMENPPAPNLRTIISPTYRQAVLDTFDDQTFTFRAVRSDNFSVVPLVKNGVIQVEDYLDLFSPAFEWLIQNVAYRGSEELFLALVAQYREYCPTSMVLQHIIALFPAHIIAKHALLITSLIKDCEINKHSNKACLYLALAKVLVRAPPPEDERLTILNDIWKVVTKLTDVREYMEISVVFVEFLLSYFSAREVNIFLKDVIKHVKEDEENVKTFQKELESISISVMKYSKDIDQTLTMDNFLPLLDLLDKANKVIVGTLVLSAWAARGASTSDTVIIHTLFDIAKAQHDSITAMSYEHESREVSQLLVSFIRTIDFGKDLEQQLNIFVDFRAAFTNLDIVTAELVQRVALLAAKAHALVKGKHTKKTAAFVKAALAYCHITIPSLEDHLVRLRLYHSCAEVALTNQMIVQAEGFVKAAIALIPEVPPTYMVFNIKRSTDQVLYNYIMQLAAFLLYFPGHPQHGPFYLALGVLNAIMKYEPWTGINSYKQQAYLGFIRLFATYAQPAFPLSIPRVESNDTLYAANEEYMSQLTPFLSKLMDLLLDDIEKIGSGDIVARKTQGTLALDLINTIVSSLTMDRHSATLVYKLFQTARACRDAIDKKYCDATYDHVAMGKTKMHRELCKKLRLEGGFEHKEIQIFAQTE